MLRLEVNLEELFDSGSKEFSYRTFVLELEHSLVSLSKWESKFERAFLGKQEKTDEETLWYIRAMVITPEVPEEVFEKMTQEHYSAINTHINAKMTATVIRELPGPKTQQEVITAELIYYWMVAMTIPFDPCQDWHLNRLLTLIRVCNVKSQPPRKMSHREVAKQQRELNAQRRQALGTRG
jgi:hypothetical protein